MVAQGEEYCRREKQFTVNFPFFRLPLFGQHFKISRPTFIFKMNSWGSFFPALRTYYKQR